MAKRANSDAAFWADADETEALERYRTLVNAIDDGIYQLDAEGRFVAVNDVITETTGYDREELVGSHVSLVLDAEDVATVEREIQRRLSGSAERTETFEFAVRTADGDRVPCELRLNLLVSGGDFRGTIGVVRDVSDRKQTEQTLTERERQLSRESDLNDRILEASPVGIMVVDSDGEIDRINEHGRRLLDISDDEREQYAPSDRTAYDEGGRPISPDERPFARALETGEPVYDRTLQIERPNGERRWLSVNAVPITDDDGEVDRVITTGEDVTDLKERERRLEGELEDVFGRVTDAFYALDDEWRITHANEHAEELIDYQGEGLVGRNFWDVFEWATDSKLGEEYRTAMATQEPTSFEFYYPEPLEAWYEVHAYPSQTGLSVYFRDVTERKRRERELEESERRYRALAENFPNGIVTLFDHDLRYTLASGRGFDKIPVEPDDLEGEHFRDVWGEETAEDLRPAFEAVLDGEEHSVELEYVGREWVVRSVPITDDEGDVFAGMTMAQDITEQKERERELRDAKSQLEAAAAAGAVGTFEWHIPDDEFVTGVSFARTFGVDPEEAREGVSLDRFLDAIHEDDLDRVERRIEEAIDSCGEYEAEYRVTDADGELRWVVARGHVECDDEGNPVTFPGALADITERKRAEQELEEHRRQLETLFEVLPVGVVVADEDGRLVEANEAAKDIWGGDVFDAESVADYDRYRGWRADTGDPVAADEWTVARVLDGEEVTDPDIYEIETADGERRTVMIHGMPVRNEDGDVVRGVVTQTDITDRKEREQRLEESNERLESFASMLAHELRNPVTIGQIYSQQLPAEGDAATGGGDSAADGGSEAVEYVTEAFDRIEDMINVMLVLTRGREAVGESTPISLADAARDVWTDIDAPEADVEVNVEGVMQADETYVQHLFRNLFENAVQHGGEDVTVEIGDLESGFYVADDGFGIPPEDRETVFEAGFTTAASEGGTGLGLAFVEELADVYDWTVTVTESEDGGARFEFRDVDLEGGDSGEADDSDADLENADPSGSA